MTIEQIKISRMNDLFDESYQLIWNQIIIPNQHSINQESDHSERAILQRKHNLLCHQLNVMYDQFQFLLKMAVDLPTKSQHEFQQTMIRQLREYCRQLGGNPANVSYIKNSDF
jgi:type VI protein secretion system component VasF